MSAQLRDINKQLEDKEFVKAYFRGVTDGNDVTQRLVRGNATLNSPDLIARMVGWLEEAEPSDSSESDSRAQAEQQLQAANLASQQPAEEETPPAGGATSSDGTTRTNATATPSSSKAQPKGFEFGK